MRATQLLESLAIGASIAAIPGPVFFELTRRTLAFGFSSGVWLAAGEFVGNGVILAAIFFGISQLLTSAVAQLGLSLTGAAILVWIGASAWRSGTSNSAPPRPAGGNRGSVSTGLALAVSSPITIALWVSLSGSYLRRFASPLAAALNIYLVALGLVVFFVPLAAIVDRARSRISPSSLSVLSKVSGAMLIVYGSSLATRFAGLGLPHV